MIIRPFEPEDAAFCFKIRAEAYIITFRDELAPDIIAECINAYMPADYIRMSEDQPFFIGVEENQRIAFFTLKKLNKITAELPLIFVKLTHLKRGIGKRCIRFIEGWLGEHWPEVETLIVETIIPKYNDEFYKRVGFIQEGESDCLFPHQDVKALRLVKKLATANGSSNSE